MAKHNETPEAQKILDLFAGERFTAFTLYGGYAVRADSSRVMFTPGKEVKERRNDKGRCTYSETEYPDGSRLVYTYSENRGYNLKIKRA